MKTFAILLLLVNIGLLAWQYQHHVQTLAKATATASHEALPLEAAPIKLVSELPELPPLRSPQAASVAPAVTAEVQADVTPADLCMDVGPFGDAPARDALRDWLREYAAAIYMRMETVRKKQFFWVYLEPSSDRAAQENLAELHNRGIQDTLLIHRGQMKNSISLGFFRSQDSVNRRLAELSEKGYKPVVVPRFETSDVYWLSARLAAQYSEPPEIPATLLSGSAQQQTIDCADMPTDGKPAETRAAEAKDAAPLVEGLTD